jgi:hypothetical protein
MKKTYNEIKEILYFIILLNNKHLRLLPSDIELFNDNIRRFYNNKINQGNLHTLEEQDKKLAEY